MSHLNFCTELFIVLPNCSLFQKMCQVTFQNRTFETFRTINFVWMSDFLFHLKIFNQKYEPILTYRTLMTKVIEEIFTLSLIQPIIKIVFIPFYNLSYKSFHPD